MNSVLPLAVCLLFVFSIGQGHGNLMQGSFPSGASAGPMGCGRGIGQGCVKSIVVNMKCASGTYVDMCNECQCAKEPNEDLSPYRETQELGYPLQGPGSLHPLMAARPFVPSASAGPMGCNSRIGQGCVQKIVDGMNCAHGTYVDMCNMCQCAKGPNEHLSFYHNVHGHGYPLEGPRPLHPLLTTRPVLPGVSSGSMGCNSRIGQGCVQNIINSMSCAHGTYVDRCNMCQCAKRPNAHLSLYRTGQVLGNPLQGPGSLHPLLVARPFPPAASAGPMECGSRTGQGCEQSIVVGMNCAHGTYVDMCNMCQCAKGPNETCGGVWSEYGRCTAKLHCFVGNSTPFVGKCRLHIDG
ncbi:uncharacterized protein LOC125039247 [Penaeus chinensis]|uniref:uncharacterized protein LOC125039247 n=1 Tax=Penaeus chinensis TaxID=139456 RepID=UPI001FB745D9|nr:uncharacterized protein LOC125039247 [Penaeus chinensis]